eukprot:TRINITY_DN1257_c0_g1_i4.p1 TRINITY_DN1257_c0_g1~~TRINITY_DN1257_c0_g1_i4.p1  ORF type:complete len:230 (-),score=39.53 TRINITY_DN1257_c0_g1_i4:56-700(-)
MSLLIVCILCAFASVVIGGSLESCDLQDNCIHFFFKGGDENGCDGTQRTTCMSWVASDTCAKEGTDTVSHSCFAPGGLKTSDWSAGDDNAICQVNSSSTLQLFFGFKDGSGKNDVCGSSVLSLWGQNSTCGSTGNHCDGGQKTECLWTINLPPCPASTTTGQTSAATTTGQTSGGNSDDNWTGPCAGLVGSSVNSNTCKCAPNNDKCDCNCKCC